MIYLINLLLALLYYMVLRLALPRQNANQAFWWVVVVHAILFRALANPYNYVDTLNYANAFRTISHWSLKEAVVDTNQYSDWGRGYVLYNWIIGRIISDTKVFFIITSVLSVAGAMLYYKKTSYAILAPVLFYLAHPMLYLMGFGVIRQHLAIPLLLFALYYMEEKPKTSLCMVIVAALLHTASIVFVPFYLLHKMVKRWSFVEAGAFFLTFFIASRFFITMVLSYLPRYGTYMQAKSSNNSLPVLIIGFTLFLLYEAKVFDRVKRGRDHILLMFMLYGFALSLFCVGLSFGGRLSLPAIYVLPTAISLLYLYGGKRKDEYKLGVVYLFALVFINIYLNLKNGDDIYQHYSFIWEKVILQI